MQKSQESDAKSVITRLGDRFGIDGCKAYETLRNSIFKQRNKEPATHGQMLTLLLIAQEHDLNPFTREIYAFEGKGQEVVPIVSIDGWARIINQHPGFDGIEFRYSENIVTPPGGKDCYEWVDCLIYRKDRSRPVIIREHLDEAYVPAGRYDGPWQTHTKRMLRHRGLIQCARIAFGFSGFYEPDEANAIIEGTVVAAESTGQLAMPIAELDRQIEKLLPRASKVGMPAIEALLRTRFKGADLEYMLAGVRGERPAVEHSEVDYDSVESVAPQYEPEIGDIPV